MKKLLIDTSCKNLIVILADETSRQVKVVENVATHSTSLLKTISELTDLSDVDYFGVCVGPGSFTGIRIGVATIKAFIFALNKKAVSVTSLDILAHVNDKKEKVICAVDAIHTFYVAKYDEERNITLAPSCLSKDEVLNDGSKVLTECDKLNVNPITLNEKIDGFIKAVDKKIEKQEWDNTLEPIYVLKSQAERDLENGRN